jgi:hypothetical protein
MDRPQTPDELITVFQRTLKRLGAGLTEMDAGDPLGVDRVAGAFRQLAVPDRGDRLLERARDQFSLGPASPIAWVTIAAPKSEVGLSFALGSVPYDKEPPSAARTVTTSELMGSRCLLVSDGHTQVSYRWVSLIAVIANKLGSVHVDDDMPKAVDELSTYVVGGVPVLRYALRIAGATVATDAHAVLQRIDPTHRPVHHQLVPDNSPWVGAVRIYGSLDSKLDIQVEVRYQLGTQLVGWTTAGRIDWLFDPPMILDVPYPDRSGAAQARPRRNEQCPCQSGRKFKHCCGT